jgi:hypothetical protein
MKDLGEEWKEALREGREAEKSPRGSCGDRFSDMINDLGSWTQS